MRLESATEFGSVYVGQVHVSNDDVGRSFIGALKRGGGAVCQIDGPTSRKKDGTQIPKHRNVVDQKNSC
jgi:hypothetical protein